MRAVLAVAACAAVVATAGAVNHIRAVSASPRCSPATSTVRSNQDPAEVAAFWSNDEIAQAQQNMRTASDTATSANGSC